jgi:hypothetical protein
MSVVWGGHEERLETYFLIRKVAHVIRRQWSQRERMRERVAFVARQQFAARGAPTLQQ